jgi:hypothetical protein
MFHLFVTVIWILIAICVLFGLYYLVIWVLGQLGVAIPPMVLKIVMLIIGLLILLWLVTALFGAGDFAVTVPFNGRR